jgi:hypothetical protein
MSKPFATLDLLENAVAIRESRTHGHRRRSRGIAAALDTVTSGCERLEMHNNERRLWAAVLKHALSDLHCEDERLRREADAWFRSTERDAVGAFLWICDVLNIVAHRAIKSIRS